MAQLSGFWSTTGTASGHQQASYTQAHWSTAAKILAACAGFEGVAPGLLNSLSCTASDVEEVTVNTGGAVVDGKWFLNDATQALTVAASAGGTTRIDRIILRCTWASFQCVLTVLAGTNSATPTAPALTQTSGTLYEIALYQALVNSSGVVTLTDERTMASPTIRARQGGSATVWANPGTNNYVPTKVMWQAGEVNVGASATVSVTFPVAFSYAPLVVFSYIEGLTALNIRISSCGADSVEFTNATATAGFVNWIAVGPQ